jgi:hypothetical protein
MTQTEKAWFALNSKRGMKKNPRTSELQRAGAAGSPGGAVIEYAAV